MFESLSDKLKRTLKNLRGEGVLTPQHVEAALREIRLALLEADVNYKVAKEFIAAVKEKAEGQQVWQELKPSEQVVKIVYDELVDLLGGTSSTGKIALWLAKNQERKPLLVSTDVNRPAAREQLKVIAKATGQALFEKPESNDAVELAREALSIKQVTGQPVKFVGVGEKYDALEPFYPDRIAQRILGMGDVLSLIEEVQSKVDQSEAEAQLAKLQKNEFTLDDFRAQLRQVKKLGSFSKIMKLLPDQLLGGLGMPDLNEEQTAQMEAELKRTEAIIDSMTRAERNDHRILNAGRRRRIALGSGTTVAEVNQLIKQYVEMRQVMRQFSGSGLFGGGGGLRGRMARRMAGMMGMPDMSGLMGGNGGDMDAPALPPA